MRIIAMTEGRELQQLREIEERASGIITTRVQELRENYSIIDNYIYNVFIIS
jgi:hypothetical protein